MLESMQYINILTQGSLSTSWHNWCKPGDKQVTFDPVIISFPCKIADKTGDKLMINW